MAQFRFHNWQDDDSTFNLNQRLKGILPDGRYRGYEAKPFVAGMNLILWHDVTGYKFIKKDLTSFAKVGCAITKQGMVINETGEISIPILPNLSGSARFDLIVMEHFYEDIVGGTAATYLSIQGTPLLPPLSDPDKQVILGYLLVPAGCTSLTDVGVSYTQAYVPFLAGDSTVFDTAINNINSTIAALNLNALTDVTITSVASGQILVYNGSQFVNISSKTHIESLQLNMSQLFCESGITHTVATDNGQNLIGGGLNEFGYIVTKNLVLWDLPSSSTRKISRLTNSPIGTIIRMTWRVATHAGILMGGAGDYGVPIADTRNRTGNIAIVTNRIYTFIKLDTYWLMSEEMPRSDYNQTDPNALDFIQNKPAPFVQTKANWTNTNPASDAFIQNKPNVMDVLARFTIQVGDVGTGAINDTLSIINNGGFSMQGTSATISAVQAGNTQQSVSINVVITNPNNFSYMVMFFVTSAGTGSYDALAFPNVKTSSSTAFIIGLKEVTTNIVSNMIIECILIKAPVSL
jgi:hypothetical protein